MWSKIREKIDKTDWKRHDQPAIVNAFYSPSKNAIIFPAGILQGLFYNHKVFEEIKFSLTYILFLN